MFFFNDVCTTSEILKAIYFVLELVKIAFIIIPIGLIVMLSLDFARNTISEIGDMDKRLKIAIKRIVFCIIIFLLSTIVNLTLDIINDKNLKSDYKQCVSNANLETIKSLESGKKDTQKETSEVKAPKDPKSDRSIIKKKKEKNKKSKSSKSTIKTDNPTNDSTPYISIKIDKSSLKAGKKANVTVKIKNSNKKRAFINPTVSISLPNSLKTDGKLHKKINRLNAGKEMKLKFKVTANNNVNFASKISNSESQDGSINIYTVDKNVKLANSTEKIRVKLKEISAPSNYGQAMISLLSNMNSYAKSRNSRFAMITNGGYELYIPGKATSASNTNVLTNSMDGMLVENVFYGINGNGDSKENAKTSSGDSKIMQKAIKSAKKAGLVAFDMEYCNKSSCKKDIKSKVKSLKSVYYIAPSLELDSLPSLSKSRANSSNCNKLSDVKNFAAILNPDGYSSKSKYFNAIKNSNYDLIFIDMYYSGKKLTSSEVSSLKRKKNGGLRYICAYISIGEAEDYRYYWKSSYAKKQPIWMATENKEWEGNYKVVYWSKQWQNILYGNNNAYFDQILNLGFDGVYLDVIDAYEFFQYDYK